MNNFIYSDNFVGILHGTNDGRSNHVSVQQINGELMDITVSEYFFDVKVIKYDDIIHLMEKFKEKYSETDWGKVIINFI